MDHKQILDSAKGILKHLQDNPKDIKKFEQAAAPEKPLVKSADVSPGRVSARAAASRAVKLVSLIKKARDNMSPELQKAFDKVQEDLAKSSAPKSKIHVAKGRAARIPGDKTNRSPQGSRSAASGGASHSPRRGSGHYSAGKNENNHVMSDRNMSGSLPAGKPSVTGKLSVSKDEQPMQQGRSEKEHGFKAGANMPAGQGAEKKDTAKGQSSAVKLQPKDETKQMTKDEESSLKHQQGRSDSEHGMLDGKDAATNAKPKEAKDSAKGQSSPVQLDPKDQTKDMTKDEMPQKSGYMRTVSKDDKPHAPGSPEDSAHDVAEEGASISSEMKQQKNAERRSRVLAHLRTLKNPSKFRSPANQAAGKE